MYIGASGAAKSSWVLSLIQVASPGTWRKFLRSAREIAVDLAIGGGTTSDQQALFGDPVREFNIESEIRVERFTVEVDGELLLFYERTSRRTSEYRLARPQPSSIS